MHRQLLLDLLARYLAGHPEERRVVERVREFVVSHPDCFARSNLEGHITGSAWLLSADRERVLLTHHAKLGRWLQLGGHADGDSDTFGVALREAREESGMKEILEPSGERFPLPLDVDVHVIPAHGAEPAHLHHDIRYLLIAAPGQEPRASDESHELRWVRLREVGSLSSEESLLRMVRKTMNLLPLTEEMR
jgi:8-oxo-dGTP pyrophosphatase MutT (NUDIX family)